MKHRFVTMKLGFSLAAIAVSGWASAQTTELGCLLNQATTKAGTVQADSGNGTYSCSLIKTSGGQLADVTSLFGGAYLKFVNGAVIIEIPQGSDGYPSLDIDLVSVSNNSGKRCNYTYAQQPAGTLTGFTTSDQSAVKYVTICADRVIESPPPPEPYWQGDECVATFSNTGKDDGTFDVAIGYSKNYFEGGLEGAAICAGPGQNRCINECVPRTTASVPPLQITGCDPVGGLVPVECAPCEYKPEPTSGLNYCWYYENWVDKFKAGSYKPSPKKKSLSANIDVTTGSDCYTVTVGPMYGGKTYSYQYCPPVK